MKRLLLSMSGIVFVVMFFLVSCEFDTSMTHVVEVEVTSRSSNITTANIDVMVGQTGTGRDGVELPYRAEVGRVRQYVGHQFPVSAAAEHTSNSGDITVTVYVNGGVFETSTVDGPRARASVQGNVINITY